MTQETSRVQRWTTLVFFAVLCALLLTLGIPRVIYYFSYTAELGRERARQEMRLEALQQRAEMARKQLGTFPDLSSGYRLVAESVAASVVHINALQELQNAQARPRSSRSRDGQSLGSGVIVDTRGFILTNNHVIAGAPYIEVRLSDGRSVTQPRDEILVGADPMMDLALLQIDLESLVAVPFGNSDTMSVGDLVLAIGNPFALDQTVTAGIVSAIGRRDVVDIASYQNFIQTDAAINVGNSGVPLVNMRGELIGINTAIVGQAGGNVGIGFAIPSNMARFTFDQLLEKGRIVRGWLGVGWDGSSADAVVGSVIEYSPAADAGLRTDDRILEFADELVGDWTDFRRIVATTPVGKTVPIVIMRESQRLTIMIKVGEYPTTELGFQVMELSEELAARLRYPPGTRGMLIQVFPRGRAEQAGLRTEDVVVQVGSDPVSDLASYLRAIRQVDLSGSVSLKVRYRDGSVRDVTIPSESERSNE